MRRPAIGLVAGIGGIVLSVLSCQSSPMAPVAPPAPSTPPAPKSISLTGTWSGNLSDAQGAALLTWTVTQSGQDITGTAVTKPANPSDGTCASCHKNKEGTFQGTFTGSTLTLTMAFPGGTPEEPTPHCAVTITGTTSNVADDSITGTYSGSDTCEGPFADGRIALTRDRQP